MKLNTKSKRLSLLFLIATFSIFFITSLHWNLTKRAFIYFENERIYYWVTPSPPKPDFEKDGHEWIRGNESYGGEWGWILYDNVCGSRVEEKQAKLIEQNPELKNMFVDKRYIRAGGAREKKKTYSQCKVQFVQDEKTYQRVIRESFSNYLNNTFFLGNFIIMIISIMGVFGLVNFLLKHIRNALIGIFRFIQGKQ